VYLLTEEPVYVLGFACLLEQCLRSWLFDNPKTKNFGHQSKRYRKINRTKNTPISSLYLLLLTELLDPCELNPGPVTNTTQGASISVAWITPHLDQGKNIEITLAPGTIISYLAHIFALHEIAPQLTITFSSARWILWNLYLTQENHLRFFSYSCHHSRRHSTRLPILIYYTSLDHYKCSDTQHICA
jgi:hypothetical protein